MFSCYEGATRNLIQQGKKKWLEEPWDVGKAEKREVFPLNFLIITDPNGKQILIKNDNNNFLFLFPYSVPVNLVKYKNVFTS